MPRGLRYQIQHPHPQGKLVQVIKGEVFDVVVDLWQSSPTFRHWVGEILSAYNHKQLSVLLCFKNGFFVLSDTAEFLYKTTDCWYLEYKRSLFWNDATVNIQWPINLTSQLAAKDAAGKAFADAEKFE